MEKKLNNFVKNFKNLKKNKRKRKIGLLHVCQRYGTPVIVGWAYLFFNQTIFSGQTRPFFQTGSFNLARSFYWTQPLIQTKSFNSTESFYQTRSSNQTRSLYWARSSDKSDTTTKPDPSTIHDPSTEIKSCNLSRSFDQIRSVN